MVASSMLPLGGDYKGTGKTSMTSSHWSRDLKGKQRDHHVNVRGGLQTERQGNARSWGRSILSHTRSIKGPMRLEQRGMASL